MDIQGVEMPGIWSIEGLFGGANVIDYLWVYSAILTLFFVLVYAYSWKVTKVWVWAGLTGNPVNIDWTKARQFLFQNPKIDKGISDVWEINDAKNTVEVRREAMGYGPHKVPIMITSSEFPCGVNPEEIKGDKYFKPERVINVISFNGELHEVFEPHPDETKRFIQLRSFKNSSEYEKLPDSEKLEFDTEYALIEGKHIAWDNRQMYVNYPHAWVKVDDFVKYQKITPDPKILNNYAKRKEIQSKLDMQPQNFLAQHWHELVIVIIAFGIVYMIISQQNIAASGYNEATIWQQKYSELANRCGGIIDIVNGTISRTGGLIK
jgi:hypothetical protein